MELAVVLPKASTQLTLPQLEQFEAAVAAILPEKDDVEELGEWLSQATALGTYIKRNDLKGPLMGAQRRIEARIGQLLPPASRRPLPPEIRRLFPHGTERHQFRLLAAGAESLTEDEWRQPRQVLAVQIRERIGHSPMGRFTNAEFGVSPQTIRRLVRALNDTARSARLARSMPPPVIEGLSDDQRREAREAIEQALFDLGGLLGALGDE